MCRFFPYRSIVSIMFIVCLSLVSSSAQDKALQTLKDKGIRLDTVDIAWLRANSSFMTDMSALVMADTTALNRAIVQMSIRLLSHDLDDIPSDKINDHRETLTKIIHGALDDHSLRAEKSMSAVTWYHMIKSELRL